MHDIRYPVEEQQEDDDVGEQLLKLAKRNVELHTQLEEAKQKLLLRELILDNLPASVYVKDLDSRHIYINQADVEIKGAASRETVIGKTDFDFFTPEQAREFRRDELEVMHTGQPLVDKVERFKDRASGHPRSLMTYKLPWVDSSGKTVGVIGIGQEITWVVYVQEIMDKIIHQLFGAESLKEIMEEIARGAIQFSNAASAVIYTIEGEAEHYRIGDHFIYPPESEHPLPRLAAGEGITLEVIQRKEMVEIEDTLLDARINPRLKKDTYRSILAVPIIQGPKVIGVLYINGRQPHKFTYNEKVYLPVLADYAVMALEKNRLIQEKEAVTRQVLALHDAGIELVASNDAGKVLQTVAQNAQHATGADWVNIILIDDKGVRQDVNWPIIAEFTVDKVRPRGEGNSYKVYDTGEPYIIPDVDTDPRNVNPAGVMPGFKSIIGVPMTIENNQRIGVLWLHYYKIQRFDPFQLKSLELYSHQGAIAYNYALRFNQIDQMSRFTREVASVLLEGHKTDTLELIVKAVQSVTNCDAILLYVHDPKCQELEHPPTMLGVWYPAEARLGGQVFRKSIVYQMMDCDEIQVIEDNERDPRTKDKSFTRREKIKSLVAAPLSAGGKKNGVMFINFREKHVFTLAELQAIQTFSDQAAAAIQTAQMISTVKTNASAFKMLSEISADISSAKNIKEVLKKIAEHARSMFVATDSEIYLLEGEKLGDTFRTAQRYQYPPPRLKYPHSLSHQVLQRKEIIFIADTSQPGEVEINQELINSGIRSIVAIPLLSRETVIGILYLLYQEIHQIDQDDITILKNLANETAIVILNERLHRDQIEALNRIASLITVEDSGYQVIMDGILNSVESLMPDLVRADILLLDQDTNQLHFYGYRGSLDDPLMAEKLIRMGEGVVGQAAQARKCIYVPDVHQHEGYLLYSEDTRSELAVPMLDRDEVIGVLNIEKSDVDGFSDTDIHLAEAITELAVISNNNNELYQRNVSDRQIQINAIGRMAESIKVSARGRHETLQSIFEWIGLLVTRKNLLPSMINILTVDPHNHKLVQIEGWNRNRECKTNFPPMRTTGVFNQVIQNKQAVMINQVAGSEVARTWHVQSQSQAVLPIIINDQLFGILNIEHILANAFEDFEELGQAITHLVSIAIQHADLYAEMTKTKRIIGGRTALAWMNLATSILYHDMRREASIILNNITLAEDDIDHITPSGVEYEQDQYKDLHTRLRGMDSAVKRILAQKEMIPLNVAELSLIPIAPTLRDLVERIKQDHLSSGVNFTYVSTLVDDQVTVLAEKEWLWKLLDILVNNGIQAMEGRKDREMVFLLDAGQDQVVFQITDTGRGMAPELVESLNNDVPPQISPSGQGLGKGLLLAQAIVEAFGGSLRVHSTSNTGTTMQLYIPVSKDRTPENV